MPNNVFSGSMSAFPAVNCADCGGITQARPQVVGRNCRGGHRAVNKFGIVGHSPPWPRRGEGWFGQFPKRFCADVDQPPLTPPWPRRGMAHDSKFIHSPYDRAFYSLKTRNDQSSKL